MEHPLLALGSLLRLLEQQLANVCSRTRRGPAPLGGAVMQIGQGKTGCVDGGDLWLRFVFGVEGLRLCSLDALHHFGAGAVRHHAAVASDVASWHALLLGCSIDCLDGADAVCVLDFAVRGVQELCDVLVRLRV